VLPILLIAVVVVIVLVGRSLRDRIGEAIAQAELDERVRAAPLVRLRQLAPGKDARVVGEARAEAELQAPLSGRACIAWHVVLERRLNGSDTDPREYWDAELTEESGNAIELADGSGQATVQLAGARWRLGNEHATQIAYELDLTEPTRAFLARHQIKWEGYAKPTYRFREHVIERGARVCIFGRARSEGALRDGGSSYRDAPAVLVFAVLPGAPLVIGVPPAAQAATGGGGSS
jgi:hypothetical protein